MSNGKTNDLPSATFPDDATRRLLRAVAWNNAGVMELVRGDVRGAIRTLSRGLRLAQRLLQHHQGDHSPSSACCCCCHPLFHLVHEPICQAAVTTFASKAVHKETKKYAGTMRPPLDGETSHRLSDSSARTPARVVCTQAVRVAILDERRSAAPRDVSSAAGALIFNLALAYHVRGDERGSATAVRLYRLALRIHKSPAVMNNLAHAAELAGDESEARRHWDELLSWVIAASASGREGGRNGLVGKVHAWCLPNLLHLMIREPATARAA